jgi:hypothetical protein
LLFESLQILQQEFFNNLSFASIVVNIGLEILKECGCPLGYQRLSVCHELALKPLAA